jgi:hypothetical protein
MNNKLKQQAMRAIVKVNKKSSFSCYNGYSFPVVSMGWKTITLQIGHADVDFGFREVVLQDLGDVRFDALQKMHTDPDLIHKINSYMVQNKIMAI